MGLLWPIPNSAGIAAAAASPADRFRGLSLPVDYDAVVIACPRTLSTVRGQKMQGSRAEKHGARPQMLRWTALSGFAVLKNDGEGIVPAVGWS